MFGGGFGVLRVAVETKDRVIWNWLHNLHEVDFDTAPEDYEKKDGDGGGATVLKGKGAAAVKEEGIEGAASMDAAADGGGLAEATRAMIQHFGGADTSPEARCTGGAEATDAGGGEGTGEERAPVGGEPAAKRARVD